MEVVKRLLLIVDRYVQRLHLKRLDEKFTANAGVRQHQAAGAQVHLRPCSRSLQGDKATNGTVLAARLLLPDLQCLGAELHFVASECVC